MNVQLDTTECSVATSHTVCPETQSRDALKQLFDQVRKIGHPDLRDYCLDQIRNARCPEEMAAVVELVLEVTQERA